ncbi:hypothetical protein Bpfe_010795 [Biomphalaria pfeifferi]|uniref:Uncharacterized protein n=1 Tax=Biomphalaria pfeifferi TaxID=112525 RepID=A0AAD8BSC3_BIOPF|nr:hypothetical protein Bpfe_010795 [Biomphalaria pfeifferi]
MSDATKELPSDADQKARIEELKDTAAVIGHDGDEMDAYVKVKLADSPGQSSPLEDSQTSLPGQPDLFWDKSTSSPGNFIPNPPVQTSLIKDQTLEPETASQSSPVNSWVSVNSTFVASKR